MFTFSFFVVYVQRAASEECRDLRSRPSGHTRYTPSYSFLFSPLSSSPSVFVDLPRETVFFFFVFSFFLTPPCFLCELILQLFFSDDCFITPPFRAEEEPNNEREHEQMAMKAGSSHCLEDPRPNHTFLFISVCLTLTGACFEKVYKRARAFLRLRLPPACVSVCA